MLMARKVCDSPRCQPKGRLPKRPLHYQPPSERVAMCQHRPQLRAPPPHHRKPKKKVGCVRPLSPLGEPSGPLPREEPPPVHHFNLHLTTLNRLLTTCTTEAARGWNWGTSFNYWANFVTSLLPRMSTVQTPAWCNTTTTPMHIR